MFMIYGLIEWRRNGNWRKCIQDCEWEKRASRFFYICVENIRFFSNLNIYRKSGWLWTPGWLWTCYRNNVMSIALVYLFSFLQIFFNILLGQCMNIINDYEFRTYFVTVHAFRAFFWRSLKTRYWNSGQTFGTQPERKNKISISGVV